MGTLQYFFAGCLLLAPLHAPAAGFWEQLTPAERRAAGLEQLSPAQQAALDRLAERYARPANEPATRDSRRPAKEEGREEVRAEVRKEMKAEAAARAVADAGRPAPSEQVVVRSRIIGKFNGWSGSTVFHLENGQTWVQTDSTDRYWTPTLENPEAEIRPSKIGGWKLYLKGDNAWVRVRRL
jgi:hypothetical protein